MLCYWLWREKRELFILRGAEYSAWIAFGPLDFVGELRVVDRTRGVDFGELNT